MELMSSLLLCAIVALPQALGIYPLIRFNNTKQMNGFINMHKKVLLNVKSTPLVSPSNEFQEIFNDKDCIKCTDCMERSIKAYKQRIHKLALKPNLMEMYNDVLKEYPIKHKRSIDDMQNSFTINNSGKNAVTKYFGQDGQVYALKIKENENLNTTDAKYNCNIYTVKQIFSCDSNKPGVLVKLPGKKTKKCKKSKRNPSSSSTAEKYEKTTPFKKREVDNIPDSYMPSIEDFY